MVNFIFLILHVMSQNWSRKLVVFLGIAWFSTAIDAQVPPIQSFGLTNAEQDQRTRQQQESRERAAAINAPAVRGEAIARA